VIRHLFLPGRNDRLIFEAMCLVALATRDTFKALVVDGSRDEHTDHLRVFKRDVSAVD
jgi:hypothetical protein